MVLYITVARSGGIGSLYGGGSIAYWGPLMPIWLDHAEWYSLGSGLDSMKWCSIVD
jgi:hypothetical protein